MNKVYEANLMQDIGENGELLRKAPNPLFRAVVINNIGPKDKKPVTVSVRLWATKPRYYVQRFGNQNRITRFVDDETELFITKLRDEDNSDNIAQTKFRDDALAFARQRSDAIMQELLNLFQKNKDEYKSHYRDLVSIASQRDAYLDDGIDFYIDLEKQLSAIQQRQRPSLNEFCVYQDDKINQEHPVTEKLPYLNPAKQEFTEAQHQLVDDFLDEFLDMDNKMLFVWYWGAILANASINDDNISKMMVLTSSRGGSGKSTLVNRLANALLGDAYVDGQSSFDPIFSYNNRFATGALLPVRLITYGEAEFHDVMNGTHNFDRLNVSEIKSMISDGKIRAERKYASMIQQKITSMQIVLTNHLPKIDQDREALRRRLLAVIVKGTKMEAKGKALNLPSEKAIQEFLIANRQAFANYFVAFYQTNPFMFTNLEYSLDEVNADLLEDQQDEAKQVNTINGDLEALSFGDYLFAQVKEYPELENDVKTLLQILATQPEKLKSYNIYPDGNDLFISDKKSVWRQLGLLPMWNETRNVKKRLRRTFNGKRLNRWLFSDRKK